MQFRRARNLELLDALDALERVAVDSVVWRAVREGRDPLLGHPSGGRWDPGQFDVLYTCFDANGAIAEIYYHLSQQPVFPSKIVFHLHEVRVKTKATAKLADLRHLEALGLDVNGYSSMLYSRSQEIGDAAYFLGFDGLIAPNARADCLNLVVFTDRLEPADLELEGSAAIDWSDWTKDRKRT